MKYLIVLSALVVCALADKLAPNQAIPIVRQSQDVNFDGTYNWDFESANGIIQSESGSNGAVQGSSQWKSPEGENLALEYTADENGFQAHGAHLPTPPPIPPQIQRALEWIRLHPIPEEQPAASNQRPVVHQHQAYKPHNQPANFYNQRRY